MKLMLEINKTVQKIVKAWKGDCAYVALYWTPRRRLQKPANLGVIQTVTKVILISSYALTLTLTDRNSEAFLDKLNSEYGDVI